MIAMETFLTAAETFKQRKNREDRFDLDDFWTESIASTQIFISDSRILVAKNHTKLVKNKIFDLKFSPEFFCGVEEWNVGYRLKHVLTKFDNCTGEVWYVIGRLKFPKTDKVAAIIQTRRYCLQN